MCSSRGAARFGLGVGDVIAAWRIYGINRRRACPRAELCNSDVIVSEMSTSNYLYGLQGACKEHGEGTGIPVDRRNVAHSLLLR